MAEELDEGSKEYLETDDIDFKETESKEPEKVSEPEVDKGKTEEVKSDSGVPPQKDDEVTGLKLGIKAERQRRQTAEGKLKEFQEKASIPDPLTDPEAYQNHIDQKAEARFLKERVANSENLMKTVHNDFDEKKEVFYAMMLESDGEGGYMRDSDGELVFRDKSLLDKMHAAQNPAEFVYTTASKQLDFKDKTSDDYEERMKKKGVDEYLATRSPSEALMPNLTTVAAAAPNAQRNEALIDDTEFDVKFDD